MIIRAFIAVVPPDDTLDTMERFLSRLRPSADYKWVTRSQLHVTLRFLGEVSAEVFDEIKSKLKKVRKAPFDVSFDRVGAFPDFSRAKVLLLSGKTGTEELSLLAEQTEQIAISCGLTSERKKFTPHLTIARTRFECNIPENLLRAMKDVPVFSWQCTDFALIQSQLTPRGPIYTPVERYSL